MPPDPPRCLRLRRLQGALQRQENIHVRCFQKYVRYFTKQLKSLTTYSQHFAKGAANGHCTNLISRSASNWQAKRKQTQTDHCSLLLPRRQRSGFCQEEGN